VECLGRVDHQVKIRGFRIELEEIEAILSRHEAVRQCVIVASEDIPGDKKLIAYYESQMKAGPDVSDLRQHLKNKLPDYMIPTSWVAMPALPLTPNGKVDRKALPRVEQQRPAQSRNRVLPRTETEENLARIWAEVLETQEAGIYDDFFEMGGHSLRAVSFIGEVERFFGIRFPLIALFHAPTIAQFAEIVDKERASRQQGRKVVDPEAIVQQVRLFIVENYLDGRANGLTDSDSFLQNEIIDPMRLHELIEFLEETYGIIIDNDALTGGNLDSIENVSRFLDQRLNAEAGTMAAVDNYADQRFGD
jgi:acyl carrier protein